jgi:hypothetical protein
MYNFALRREFFSQINIYCNLPQTTRAYWQDYVDLFNRANPSGNVVNDVQWHQLIIICIVVGLVVSLKRFWLGLYLGRQTFCKCLMHLLQRIVTAVADCSTLILHSPVF